MQCLIAFCVLFVHVCAHPRNDEDKCAAGCSGEKYDCVNGKCYCADGYILNLFHTSCVKCPGLGEKCYGRCCDWNEDFSLQCHHGTCKQCFDTHGNWICGESLDQYMMVTISEVAMGTALVLGIIATLLLIAKLCSADNLRPMNIGLGNESRLSIGSLQLHVEERLRDAPPKYTRMPPPGTSINPTPFFINAGFVHDSSIPPPVYTDSTTNNEVNNPNTHM